MPKVLNKEEVNELEEGSSTGYVLSKMSALDLIKTVHADDKEIKRLREALEEIRNYARHVDRNGEPCFAWRVAGKVDSVLKGEDSDLLREVLERGNER